MHILSVSYYSRMHEQVPLCLFVRYGVSLEVQASKGHARVHFKKTRNISILTNLRISVQLSLPNP